VRLVFLVPSVKQVQMVVLLFLFYLLQSHAVLQLLMLNLPRWFLFLECLYVFVCCWRNIAWIIGWALIMEYSVGNITVAISGDYFTGLLESGGLSLPQWVQMDFLSSRDLMMPQP
jgi:hypothetical protein